MRCQGFLKKVVCKMNSVLKQKRINKTKGGLYIGRRHHVGAHDKDHAYARVRYCSA